MVESPTLNRSDLGSIPNEATNIDKNMQCKYCKKEYNNKKSLVQHEIRCKENPNKIYTSKSWNNGNRPAWNNGLTKDTDERLVKASKKLSKTTKGKPKHKQSEETKNKISKSMKKYLSENPDKVPYLVNHSSKISYPEEYFIDLFKTEDINLKYHLQISKYKLDFYNKDLKLDVEIDGEQHYNDKRIYKSDRERDKFLKDLGWTVFRIRWSEYRKLNFKERKDIINKIKNMCQ